jgi:drug/metabolite transporter (DMT)-like permease
MAIAPLLTALFARVFLRHTLPTRTWVAIGVAGLGIAWMFGRAGPGAGRVDDRRPGGAGRADRRCHQLVLLQHLHQRHHQRHAADPSVQAPDMLPAVLIGALLSAAITLPMALPFSATPRDLGLLAGLGVVQLAIPCLLAVVLTRVLPAPEISLLACWR